MDLGEQLQNFNLVVLPVNNLVVFPKSIIPFTVTDKAMVEGIKECIAQDKSLVFLSTKVPKSSAESVYRRGVIGIVKHSMEVSEGTIKLVIESISKADITRYSQRSPHFRADIIKVEEVDVSDSPKYGHLVAAMRNRLSPYLTSEILSKLNTPFDFIAVLLELTTLPLEALQKCLEKNDDYSALQFLNEFLNMRKNMSPTEGQMHNEDGKGVPLSPAQQAQQIMAAKHQEKQEEIDDLATKIKKIKFPDHIQKELDKQLGKLAKLNPDMSEYYTTRNYIDWILDIPWDKEDQSEIDLKKISEELDKSHYGLVDIKERILEYMAVQKLNSSAKGSIMCFISPPGTGKTSIAKSVAKALNRKFVKIALGGVRDEAEIRGHRRTYVSSMPGKIIQALKSAGTMNPVILLDEIDKMGNDAVRGSPSAALLEALDPEQNPDFVDHFINMGVDLSKVFFIATGNDSSTIEHALYDRLEIIRMEGYSEREKTNIATQYLIPEVCKETNIPKNWVTISDTALSSIINSYTRESGVRELRRKIESIYRKVAKSLVMEEAEGRVEVTQKNLHKYLGPEKIFNDKSSMDFSPGMVFGLAWNGAGGDVLPIEVTTVEEGKGEFQITGNLGKVMEESVKVALTYLKSNAKKFGLEASEFKKVDFHFHFPEGAISKDGPSAGNAITMAIVSKIKDFLVPKEVAMTGEITINGAILAVGGIKEKVLSAKRNGVKKIFLPKSNETDVQKLDAKDVKGMEFVYVGKFEEVYSNLRAS